MHSCHEVEVGTATAAGNTPAVAAAAVSGTELDAVVAALADMAAGTAAASPAVPLEEQLLGADVDVLARARISVDDVSAGHSLLHAARLAARCARTDAKKTAAACC